MNNIDIGKYYEKCAQEYLKRQGLTFVEKNYFSIYGEIDIIMRESDIIVFFEVKYRKDYKYGYVEEHLSHKKVNKIILTAYEWLKDNQINFESTEYRFDYLCFSQNKHHINWIKNITDL